MKKVSEKGRKFPSEKWDKHGGEGGVGGWFGGEGGGCHCGERIFSPKESGVRDALGHESLSLVNTVWKNCQGKRHTLILSKKDVVFSRG